MEDIEQKQVFLSIIIPVYNTPQDMLKRCIQSIRSQSCESWEIILIDDGSTTLSEQDFESASGGDRRIRRYRQQNSGVSAARNHGLSQVKGKYFAFVDGDDVVKPYFIQEAKQYADHFHAELIIGTIEYSPGDELKQGTETPTLFFGDDVAFVKKSLIGIPQDRIPHRILGTPCGRIFRADFAGSVLFPENITIREDQIYNREFLEKVNSVLIVPNVWYTYYQNDFSAMHTRGGKKSAKMFQEDRLFWRHWNRITREEKLEEIKKEMLIHSIHGYCTAIRWWLVPMRAPYSEKRRLMEEMYDDYILKEFIPVYHYRSLKRRIMKASVQYRMNTFLYLIQLIKSLSEEEV